MATTVCTNTSMMGQIAAVSLVWFSVRTSTVHLFVCISMVCMGNLWVSPPPQGGVTTLAKICIPVQQLNSETPVSAGVPC